MGEIDNVGGGKIQPITSPKKHFYHVFRIFGLNIYMTTLRLRRRQSRDERNPGRLSKKPSCVTKRILYAETCGCCQYCGKQFPYKNIQLHHVLPWWKFPEYDGDIRNSMLLCNDCHKTLHTNPYREIEEMERVAGQLGINLQHYYC